MLRIQHHYNNATKVILFHSRLLTEVSDNFEFDPSIIRGLEYYTGAIFEVNLKFDVTNNKGKVIQFGSIGGGGRYDNLVKNFGKFDAPATGISIGLDRLVYALMQKKKFKVKRKIGG